MEQLSGMHGYPTLAVFCDRRQFAGEKLGKYSKNPRSRHQVPWSVAINGNSWMIHLLTMSAQVIDNLSKVMPKIQELYVKQKVRLQISAEDMADSKKQQVLGMIWVLIHKFSLEEAALEGGGDAKEGLLFWAQRSTARFGITISNFTTSWTDGTALIALVRSHFPDFISTDEVGSCVFLTLIVPEAGAL